MADGSTTQRQAIAQRQATPAPIPGEEIAVAWGERDITRSFLKPDGTLYNEDVVLQLQAGGDLRVYEDLLRDDQVASTFEQRRSAVTGSNWSVEPGADDAQSVAAAVWLEENLNRIGWDQVTEKMLFTRFYGWGVAELLWDVFDGKLGWAACKVRDRKRFLFQADGRCYLDTGVYSASPQGRIYAEAPYFWVLNSGGDNSDNPYGRGLANQLFWPVRFKRDGIRFWLVYLEKFAMPTAVGKMPAATETTGTATTLRRQRLLSAIKALQTQAGVVIPDDMAIELLEAKRTGSADYEAMHARMDAAIAKIVVGQTLTSDVGDSGSRALGDVHNSVRMDLVKSDADLVCESFNRGPATWLTELNFAGAKPPRVKREVEEKADLGALATQLVQLKTVGFRPKLTLVQANWGADMEENPDPPPQLRGLGPDGKPLPPKKPGQPGDDSEDDQGNDDEPTFAAAIQAMFPDQVALDGALDAVETRLATLSREMLNPVLEYAANHSPAEMAAAIATALPGWKPDQVEEALARVIFVSRTWGRINGRAP